MDQMRVEPARASKPRTWRLKNCRGCTSKELLRDKLFEALKEADSTANILQLSMAQYEDTRFWATVTLSDDPPQSIKTDYQMDKDFMNITPLIDNGDAEVDIVVLPGLGSHALGSFLSPDGVQVWLRDWLQLKQVRLLLYGYDTQLQHSLSKTTLQDLAKALLMELPVMRENHSHRPLIFVAHSLGGLIVKEALALALQEHQQRQLRQEPANSKSDLFWSTTGLVFFGVPNHGLRSPQLTTAVAGQPNEELIRALQVDKDHEPSQFLAILAQRFRDCFEHQDPPFDLVAYYERKESKTLENKNGKFSMTGPTQMIVTQRSACDIGLGNNYFQEFPLSTDHSGLVKFSDEWQPAFRAVREQVNRLVSKAPQIIEHRSRNLEKRVTIAHRVDFSLRGIPVVNRYVGREEELSHMEEYFGVHSKSTSMDRRKVFVLYGGGGIGKTQLAAEFTRRHQSHYTAIAFLDGSSEERLKLSLLDFAHRIPQHELPNQVVRILKGNRVEQADEDVIVQNVQQWFSLQSNWNWLLILDNVDRDFSSKKDPQAYDIWKYVPYADHGSVLITSRLSSLRRHGESLKTGPLNMLESRKVLENNAGRLVPDGHKLIEKLGGLPLALTQAGSFLQETNSTVDDYIRLYDKKWKQLMDSQDEFSLQEYDRSVLTTFVISYEQVTQHREEAAALLRLWGFFDNNDVRYDLIAPASSLHSGHKIIVPSWLIRLAADELEFSNCIRVLVRFSFVDPMLETLSHTMHPVLHEWCLNLTPKTERYELGALAACLVVTSIPAQHEKNHWTMSRRLLSHGLRTYQLAVNIDEVPDEEHRELEAKDWTSCIERTELYFELPIWILSQLADLFDDCSQLRPARHILSVILQHDLPQEEMCRALNVFGNVYSKEGYLAKSERLFQKGLEIATECYGSVSIPVLRILNSLGIDLKLLSRYDESDEVFRRVVNGYEKLVEPTNPLLLDACGNYGDLLLRMPNREDQAEHLLLRALRGFEAMPESDNLGSGRWAGNLALLYKRQGRMSEAKELQLQALKIKEEQLGLLHWETLDTVQNLGNLYRRLEQTEKAKELLERALSGYAEIGLKAGPFYDTHYNLAVVYKKSENWAEARDMYDIAFKGYSMLYGLENRETTDARDWMLKMEAERVHALEGAD